MSNTLTNGEGFDLSISPGNSLTVVAVSGSYNASIVDGVGKGTALATNGTGGTYGSYASGAVIRLISSALSEVDYDIGVSPVIVSDTPVMAQTNPLTGGIEFSTDVSKGIYRLASDESSILCLGGDHPYIQWWGTDGTDGMAAAYLDRGMLPYIAINTAEGYPGSSSAYMSWEQCRILQSRGVEFVAHGHRHIMRHMRINTGLRIRSTNAGTNTVNITTTGVVLSDTPNGTTTLLFATYPTVGQLVSAINAVPGWVSVSDAGGDLFDDDASALLMPLKAARTVTATSATQFFGVSGGVTLSYGGTAYQDVRVRVTQGAYHNFEVYFDGVRVLNFDTSNASYNTLTKLITAIRAAAIAGLTVWLCDNGREQTGVDFPSYCVGDEDSFNLETRSTPVSIMGGETRFGVLNGAIGVDYGELQRRNYDLNKQIAAENGINLKNYAVSGSQLMPWMLRGYRQFASYRVGYDSLVTFPVAMWSDTLQPGMRLYWTADSVSYSNMDRVLAVRDAIADSGPVVEDVLTHKIIADGSSRYSFQDGGDSYHDQTETAFIAHLDKIKGHMDAGRVRVMPPEEARLAIKMMPAPRNRVFNPQFRNSGESIKVANNGMIVPFWAVDFSGASVSSASVDASAGEISYTTTSAVSINILSQVQHFKPGATYEIGFYLDISPGATGSGLRVLLQAYRNPLRGMFPAGNISGGDYRLVSGWVTHRLTIPKQIDAYPGRVISKSGPFDLSTNKNVRININLAGQISVDLSSGAASASAVTAKEAAAAINAAIAASASYTPEYHNCAKAVGSKVVIENPYFSAYQNYYVDVITGATLDASTTVFGGTQCFGMTEHAAAHGEQWPWWVRLQSNMTGTVKIKDPFVQKIRFI